MEPILTLDQSSMTQDPSTARGVRGTAVPLFLGCDELPLNIEDSVIDKECDTFDETLKCGFCDLRIDPNIVDQKIYLFKSSGDEEAEYWYLCLKCYMKGARLCHYSRTFCFSDDLVAIDDDILIKSELTDVIDTYSKIEPHKRAEFLDMCGIDRVTVTEYTFKGEGDADVDDDSEGERKTQS